MRKGEVTRIYVESKNLEGAGNQALEFRRFLAQAYSATKNSLGADNKGIDPKWEFMWATTCPWKGDGFRTVADWQEVRKAAEWDSTRDETIPVAGSKLARAVPAGHVIDEDVARMVADRIWVWVISVSRPGFDGDFDRRVLRREEACHAESEEVPGRAVGACDEGGVRVGPADRARGG